jgi:hypothetical protein
LIGGLLSGSCGSGEPRTDAERLARGRELVGRMSAALAKAPGFSVTTHEVRTELRTNGEERKLNLTREVTVRRPDRLYSKLTGDRANEVWYDGIGITVVMPADKAFGQARAPETLDKTLDALHERYGVATPIADFAYTSPADALLADTTTGGWVGRETLSGQETDHLAFKDEGVNWELWLPVTGEPLPLKVVHEYPDGKRLRRAELTFSNWNLAPQIAADRFAPKVPEDYEGIAIVQRARVLRNTPEDQAAP